MNGLKREFYKIALAHGVAPLAAADMVNEMVPALERFVAKAECKGQQRLRDEWDLYDYNDAQQRLVERSGL